MTLFALNFGELFKSHPITAILFFGWHVRTALIDWLGSDWKAFASFVGLLVELVVVLFILSFVRWVIRKIRGR